MAAKDQKFICALAHSPCGSPKDCAARGSCVMDFKPRDYDDTTGRDVFIGAVIAWAVLALGVYLIVRFV